MNVSIDDFLPVDELVSIPKPDGSPSGAFAKVVPFPVLQRILARGTDDMMAFGYRLLAAAMVTADGQPVASEEEWSMRTTNKNQDRVLALIKFVGEVNGVLTKDKQTELGNDSSGTGASSSSSSSVSDSDAPVESCASASVSESSSSGQPGPHAAPSETSAVLT